MGRDRPRPDHETVRYLLDTSVLIATDGTGLPGDATAAISVMSLSELHRWVLLAQNPVERAARLRRLTTIENAFDALPVTDSVARLHGAMGAAVVAAGRQPRKRAMDLLIAATAADSDAVLLTHNLDDFAALEDFLEVLHPGSP